jgi:hypothetical protein
MLQPLNVALLVLFWNDQIVQFFPDGFLSCPAKYFFRGLVPK